MAELVSSPRLDTQRVVDKTYSDFVLSRGTFSCAAGLVLPATTTCLVEGCTSVTAIADSGVCELHTGGQRGKIGLCERVHCLRSTGCGEFCQTHGIGTYGVFVKQSGLPGAGLGLFAAVPFKADARIALFNGTLCSARDAELRWGDCLCINGHCIQKPAFAKQIYGGDEDIGDDAADEDWALSSEDDGNGDGPQMEVDGEAAGAKASADRDAPFADPIDREGTRGNSRSGSKRSAGPPISAAQRRSRLKLARARQRAAQTKARAKAEADARTYCYIDTYGVRSFARFANDPTRCAHCVSGPDRCEECNDAPPGSRPRVNAALIASIDLAHNPDSGPDHVCAVLVAAADIAAGAEIFIMYTRPIV